MENQKPEKKFSASPVSATIWKNTGISKSGEPAEYRTISIQRAYKDKAGKWQHTSSFRVNDLPKAALVLTKAYEYLVLKAKEPSSGSNADDIDIEVEEIY